MKINLPKFILLLLFSFSFVNAQEFKLGKVSVAELEEKFHPKDSSAVAAILFKKGEVRFDYSQEKSFEIITTIKTRIKIYKSGGYSFANHNVPYFSDNGLGGNVTFDNAFTYNLVDGKIEKTKLKSDGIFTEKINENFAQKKITMPNVKEGSVIEFEYSTKSNNIGSLMDWNFQMSIPVNYSEFVTNIPEYFEFRINQKGFFPISTQIEKSGRNINYTVKLHSQSSTGISYSNQTMSFTEVKSNYSCKDLPAIKEEAFVNNIKNYITSVSHELSSISYPQQHTKYYSASWESVVKTIYNYDGFGPELNKTGYFEEDIKKLVQGLNDPSEIISKILNYVKTTIKWNNNKGYGCKEGVKMAYKNKIGNCAEINLMLTAMLRFAGLNTNPVLISTRENGITYFPNRNAFNFVIAAVETSDGLVLLDATEKYSEPNILPLRDLNWVGRLIRKDETSTEVDLMPKTLSMEARSIIVSLKSDGSIEGQTRNQFSNHAALEYRKKNLGQESSVYLDKLENKYNGVEIEDYSRENDLNTAEPIIEKFKFKGNKNIEIISDKLYVSPMLFFTTRENPFKQEERIYPIDFGFPKQERFTININIPSGYTVESIPNSLNIVAENIGKFKFIITNTESTIQVAITKDITSAIVSSELYSNLKGFFKQIIDKQNEKIVLKKL